MFFERHVHQDSDLPIYYQHQSRSPKEPKYEFHWHETAELILVTAGCVEIRINNVTTRFGQGDLIFINPQAPHCFSAFEGDCSYHCLIPDNSIFAAGGINVSDLCTDPLIDDQEIKTLYLDIVREYTEQAPYYKSCIKAKLLLMAALLIRRYGKEGGDTISVGDNAMRITKEAIKYMEEHYAEELGGEMLATALGFSHSYLCHVINKVTGQSLTENLLYVRCRKARELLRQGVHVGEVVFLSGFKNASYFCRTYKRMMGVSPSVHRKK